jgi:hypothetical protein
MIVRKTLNRLTKIIDVEDRILPLLFYFGQDSSGQKCPHQHCTDHIVCYRVLKPNNFFRCIDMGICAFTSSVADPDPSDLYVFMPPGSGSISLRFGSGSGSFYHQANIVRRNLILLLNFFLTFLSFKNDVNVPLKTNQQKTFLYCILKVNDEISRIRIRIWIH